MVLRKLNEIGSLYYTTHKNRLKIDQKLKYKTWDHKTLARKQRRKNSLTSVLAMTFLHVAPKAQATNTSGSISNKRVLHSKENNEQSERATYEMRENIWKPIFGKALISTYIKNSYNLIAIVIIIIFWFFKWAQE